MKLSDVVNDIVSSSVKDKKSLETVMSAWNAKKAEVTKLFSAPTRTGKRKKDPNAPKKWMTGYLLFCGDQRKKLENNTPKLSATDITKKLGELWKAVSEKEKKKYEELSKKDKERYENEMKDYVPPESDGEEDSEKKTRKVKKERTGPKRPKSSYLYFCDKMREVVKQENPEMGGKEITIELGARWKALTEEDKVPYISLQATDKERYESEKNSGETKPAETKKGGKKAEAKVETKPAPAETKKGGKKTEAKVETKPAPAETKKGGKKVETKKTPGYEYYYNEQIEDIQDENPDWTSKQIEAEVQKNWKAMSGEDREGYELEAGAESELGSVQMDE